MNYDETIKNYLDNGKTLAELVTDLDNFRNYVKEQDKQIHITACQNWLKSNKEMLLQSVEYGIIQFVDEDGYELEQENYVDITPDKITLYLFPKTDESGWRCE